MFTTGGLCISPCMYMLAPETPGALRINNTTLHTDTREEPSVKDAKSLGEQVPWDVLISSWPVSWLPTFWRGLAS